MNQQSAPINLLRIWNVFKKLWIVVLLLAVIGGAFFYIRTKATSVPVYRAEAIMYATKLEDNQYSQYGQSSGVSASDLSLRNLLLNDCLYLANSPLVVQSANDAIRRAGYGNISSSQITAQAVESTRYFKVAVVTTNPDWSNKALTEVCSSIKEQVKRIMDVDNIEKISQSPAVGPIVANPRTSGMKGVALGVILGFLIVAIVAFTDRTVKNEEEFATLFPDIPVIGTIPEFNLQAERNTVKRSEKQQRRANLDMMPNDNLGLQFDEYQ